MRCEEVQEYLAERLAGSLSDRLSGMVHAHVRAHMLACPDCCDEMEDFEEMQSALRAIPIEPCDSEAMRARFDLLMGTKAAKTKQLRPVKILLVATVAMAILAIAVVALRDVQTETSISDVPPQVPPGIPVPQPIPVPAQPAENSGSADPEARSEVPVSQLVTVDVTVREETGARLPYKPDTSIVFTETASAFRVAASCVVGNLFRAMVPANESFTVSVSNVAPGYSVESVVDADKTDLLHGGLLTPSQRASPSRIVVTLKKN